MIKNIIIDPEERYERSYTRKAKEVILAMEITRQYSKEQILEWYLNYNFYGNFAYGIEAASRVYFDKSASELTMEEAVMLVDDSAVPGAEPHQQPAGRLSPPAQGAGRHGSRSGADHARRRPTPPRSSSTTTSWMLSTRSELISQFDRDNAATDKPASDRVLDALVDVRMD